MRLNLQQTSPDQLQHTSFASQGLTCSSLLAGLWLCVKAYGSYPIIFSLKANATQCPSNYDARGGLRVCNSPVTPGGSPEPSRGEQRYSQCTPEGICVCKGQYRQPAAEVYPGESCPWCAALQCDHSGCIMLQEHDVTAFIRKWCFVWEQSSGKHFRLLGLGVVFS